VPIQFFVLFFAVCGALTLAAAPMQQTTAGAKALIVVGAGFLFVALIGAIREWLSRRRIIR